MYVCLYACMLRVKNLYVCMHMCTYIYASCGCVCTCALYVRLCINTHAHTHTCIHTDTCIYTYIHYIHQDASESNISQQSQDSRVNATKSAGNRAFMTGEGDSDVGEAALLLRCVYVCVCVCVYIHVLM